MPLSGAVDLCALHDAEVAPFSVKDLEQFTVLFVRQPCGLLATFSIQLLTGLLTRLLTQPRIGLLFILLIGHGEAPIRASAPYDVFVESGGRRGNLSRSRSDFDH
jgi:hypothetical protein